MGELGTHPCMLQIEGETMMIIGAETGDHDQDLQTGIGNYTKNLGIGKHHVEGQSLGLTQRNTAAEKRIVGVHVRGLMVGLVPIITGIVALGATAVRGAEAVADHATEEGGAQAGVGTKGVLSVATGGTFGMSSRKLRHLGK